MELELEDPTEVGDDVISSEEEGGQEVMTSVVHREPTTMSANGGLEAERHGDLAAPRNCAASSDVIGEREAKQTRSPCSSEASLALSSPGLGTKG